VTSWDTLGLLLWFGLPAWAGVSLYRLTRTVPEEEPQKWEGLTPTLFRGLLFCVLGHLAYGLALPLMRQWPPLAGLLLPRAEEMKRHAFATSYLLTLVVVVIAAAIVGAVGGVINGWGLRLWRWRRRRARLSPNTVWDEVFDGSRARWAVLYLAGGKVYEGQIERWSSPGEADPHILLASPSEYIRTETPGGTQWHVLDLQSDGLLIPRSRVELIELRPTVEEWIARQRTQSELAAEAS
jgi:energy-converting hydrogenase Eha subunit G